MSLSLKEVKSIKYRYQITVFGYIRDYQNRLNLRSDIIQTVIPYTCLAYYYQPMDEFDKDKCGSSIILSEDKLTIQHASFADYDNANCTAICKQWIA